MLFILFSTCYIGFHEVIYILHVFNIMYTIVFIFSVLHGLALQLYLKLGMKLLKISRVVSFTQDDYLKTWVNFCTEKRSAAKDDFSRNFWKMVNTF